MLGGNDEGGGVALDDLSPSGPERQGAQRRPDPDTTRGAALGLSLRLPRLQDCGEGGAVSPDRLPFVSPSAPTALTSGGLADGEPLPRTFKHLGSPTVVTGSLVLPVSLDSSFLVKTTFQQAGETMSGGLEQPASHSPFPLCVSCCPGCHTTIRALGHGQRALHRPLIWS